MEVVAADIDVKRFKVGVPLMPLDLNEQDFDKELGTGTFGLVTAIVIEHVESPIGFLCNVRRLLKPQGVAIITTPYVRIVLRRVSVSPHRQATHGG